MKSEVLSFDGTAVIVIEFDPVLDRAQVEQMAGVVQDRIRESAELRLLLNLRRTERIEAGAFASGKGLATSLKSIGPVSRYAVVGAPKTAAAAVEAFGKLLPLESRAFEADAFREAQAWVVHPPG
jgi:hypothetical protein